MSAHIYPLHTSRPLCRDVYKQFLMVSARKTQEMVCYRTLKTNRSFSVDVINCQMLPALITARHKVNKTELNCCSMVLQ